MTSEAGDREGKQAETLRVAGLTKAFADTLALDDVSFDVRGGEIHGLIGANGSGKSTLIKILAGVYQADAGVMAFGGTEHDAAHMSPGLARAAGFRFVHQSQTALPDLSVAENLAVGRGFPRGLGGRIRWSELYRRTTQVLERFEIEASPRQSMRSLGPAVRMMVAIAGALQDLDSERAGILVLDEPTAALPEAEVGHLLDALRRYARAGQGIVFVSHRLDETLSVCHRVTVLRDGRHVATRPSSELNEAALIELMVGRVLGDLFPDATAGIPGDLAIEAHSVVGGPLRDVSLSVRAGEVVGVAGLLGSGRTELLQTLFGVRDPGPGSILLRGQRATFGGPREAMAAGIAYVPEDRSSAAAFLDLSVAENLSIARLKSYWSGLRMDKRQERADARASISGYSIKAPSYRAEVGTLSGGNQQKVMLARWLARKPAVLLLDEPTQGVDVSSRADIYRLIRAAVADGCAVLVVSSDFEELIHACDRILILANGRVTRSITASAVGSHQLTELVYADLEVAA